MIHTPQRHKLPRWSTRCLHPLKDHKFHLPAPSTTQRRSVVSATPDIEMKRAAGVMDQATELLQNLSFYIYLFVYLSSLFIYFTLRKKVDLPVLEELSHISWGVEGLSDT